MKKINSLAIALILIISLFGISGCGADEEKEASGVALEVAGGYKNKTTKKQEAVIPELIVKHISVPGSIKPTKLGDSEGDSDPNEARLGIKPEPSTDSVLDRFNISLTADGYAVKMHSSTIDIDGTTIETKVLDAEKEIEGGRVNVRIQGQIEQKGEDSVEKKLIMILNVSHY